MPCRINRRRMWTARIVLEAAWHREPSSMVNLTYAPRWLPEGGTVVPDDAKKFWRDLRNYYGRPIRYYLVGEYGDRSGRPHYHCIFFGVVPAHDLVCRLWGKAEPQGIHVGSVTVQSAEYVAGYVTKKWTKKDDPRLYGRHPEFSRMSLKPGIGMPGLQGIINWLYTEPGVTYLQRNRDVPKHVRFGGKIYPLGRYLVAQLRLEFGIDTTDRDLKRALLSTARAAQQNLPDVRELRENNRQTSAERAEWKAREARKKLKL